MEKKNLTIYLKIESENCQGYPKHCINHHFGGEWGNQTAHQRGGVRIGIGQPGVQGEKGHFHKKTAQTENKGQINNVGWQNSRQNPGNVCHIEGSGHQVKAADAKKIKTGSDGSHEKVIKTG